MYGGHGKVKSERPKVQNYMGKILYSSYKNKLQIDITNYMDTIVDNFTTKLKPNGIIPDTGTEYLFGVTKTKI